MGTKNFSKAFMRKLYQHLKAGQSQFFVNNTLKGSFNKKGTIQNTQISDLVLVSVPETILN